MRRIKRIALAFILGTICAAAFGGEPTVIIRGPATAKTDVPVFLSARGSADYLSLDWNAPGNVSILPIDADGLTVVVTFGDAGPAVVTLTAKSKPATFNGAKKGPDGHYTDEYVAWLEAGFGVAQKVAVTATHSIDVLPLVAPQPVPPTPPGPQPVVNPYPVPSVELQKAAAPIKSLPLESADARKIADVYAGACKDGNCKTTEQLRNATIEKGKALSLRGKYSGLSGVVEEFLKAQLGLQSRQLTDKDRQAVLALAWALWR